MFSKLIRSRFLVTAAELRPENGFPKLNLSYCHNAGTSILTNKTVDEVVKETAERVPNQDGTIFHTEKIKFTWSETYQKTKQLADGSLQLGLKPGDRIGMWAPSIKEWPLVQYACAEGGFIIVTLNPLYTSAEAEFACKAANVRAIIAPPSMLNVQPYLK